MAHSLDLESSSSQYASIADASQTGLDLTGDFSLECWVKLEELPSTLTTDMMMITKWDTTLNQRNYRMYGASVNDSLKMEITTDGTAATISNHTSSANFFGAGDVGVWVHVAVTFESATNIALFYKNGALHTTDDLAGSPAPFNGSAPFAIGTRYANNVPAFFFDGLIDDVRVWNDLRTGPEISANYNHILVGNESNLVGYWKFDNDYEDATSNNNDLTPSGSPSFSTSKWASTAYGQPVGLLLSVTYSHVTGGAATYPGWYRAGGYF